MKKAFEKRSTPRTAGARLLRWYDENARKLPWRAEHGRKQNPYRVWLSEIMLQQTTAAAVSRYYLEFIERWPSVAALASAPLDDILGAWAGLGYYARARNLHRAAQIVAGELNGEFPRDIESLRKLPGVGAYTAGAIAAIAFDGREVAVDANAERVLSRFFAVEEPLPQAKSSLRELAYSILPASRPGHFAQALMDLGATICSPKTPSCESCPWSKDCRGYALGIQSALPRKAKKPSRPGKRGAAYVARDSSGAVLLERRPHSGLLGGMLQPPLGPWAATFPSIAEALRQAPFRASWSRITDVVRHVFTHFELELLVYSAEVTVRPNHGGLWLGARELESAALPTVMRKVLERAGVRFSSKIGAQALSK